MKQRPDLVPADHSPVGEKLYTVKEVADLMKVTPETVRNWIRNERVTALRHPGRLMVTQSELTRIATSNF
jgi:excisionase family DNA binding protein